MALPPAVLEGVLGAPKGGQNGEQAVECLACGERLPSARALVTHLVRRHFRGAAFPCPSCGVAVVTVRQLQHHLRRHAGERLHPCARCARPFATMFTLRRHQRLNRCGARHACARCGRSFASAALLDKHGRKHEPRRRGASKCAKCGTRFAVRAELYAHERSIHGDLRPYPCDLCELAFYKRTGLLKHVQRAHATTTASRLHLHAAPLTPPPSPPPSHSAAPERPDDLELPWPSPGTPSTPSGPAEPASLEPALQHDGLEHPPPKKRGRPRKSDKSALRQDGVENLTYHPPPKKRGRPRKSEQCDKHEGSENPSPKKRGRPRKSEQSANSPPKKRGRPRKSEQRDKSCSEKQTEGPSDTLRTLPGPSSSSSHSPPRKRGRARRPEQGDRRCHARLSVRLFGKTAESRLEKWRRIQLVRRQSMELRRLAPLCLPAALAPLCLPPALAPLCLPAALTPQCLPPAPLARLNDAALPPKKRGRPRKAEQSDSPSAGKGAKLRAKLSGKPKRPLNGKRNLKTSLKLDSKLNARLCVEITGLSRKHLETLTGVELPEKRLGTPRTSPLLGIPEPNVYGGPPAPEGTTTLAPAPLEQAAGVENSPPKKRGRPPKSEKNIKSSVQLSGKTTKTQLDKPSSKHNLKKSLKMSNRLTARPCVTPAVPLDGVENAPPKRRPGRPRKPEGRPETEPKLSGDQSAATRVKLSGVPCRKQLVKLSVAKPRAKVQVGGKWTRQACKPLGSVQGFLTASAGPSGSKNGLKEGVRSGPKSRVKWVCAECGARFPLEWSLKGHLLHTHLQHARLSVR